MNNKMINLYNKKIKNRFSNCNRMRKLNNVVICILNLIFKL